MKMARSGVLATTIMMGLTILIVMAMNGCSSVQPAPVSGKQQGEKILVGKLTEEELFKRCPLFQEQAARYVPDPATVERLRKVDRKTEILLFLGTWCPDSISEAPKLIKIYDTVKNSNFSLQIIGVDRAKQDGLGLTTKYDVKRVPTVVFLRDGRELGRIIEYPAKTMEEDTLTLLLQAR